MQYSRKNITAKKLPLLMDHYVSIPYDCSGVDTDENGCIPAGTFIPSNDGNVIGVLFQDVYPAENPNGALIIHGFIDKAKLPEEPTATCEPALPQIRFI